MPTSLSNSLAQRRYRLAQAATVAGSLALGTLVLNRLVDLFRNDFALYYGVSDRDVEVLRANVDAQVPLTLGQFTVTLVLFIAVFAFLWAERRRMRQAMAFDAIGRGRRTEIVVERVGPAVLYEQFVLRTSAFAGVLQTLWLLQVCADRWLGGFGWGLDYTGWTSLLPLASIFGLCVLAGMLVAAISLYGLRAISVLELALRSIAQRRVRRAAGRVSVRRHVRHTAHTFRERFGCDILSRPPPVLA